MIDISQIDRRDNDLILARSIDETMLLHNKQMLEEKHEFDLNCTSCCHNRILDENGRWIPRLQVKHLNLSSALDLVDSVIQVLKEIRNEDVFNTKIWEESQKLADEAGVAVTLPNPGRRTSLPARFREGQVLESTGRRDQGMLSVYDSYKALYFQVVDKVLMELDKRFGESRPLLKSIAVLSHPRTLLFLT